MTVIILSKKNKLMHVLIKGKVLTLYIRENGLLLLQHLLRKGKLVYVFVHFFIGL